MQFVVGRQPAVAQQLKTFAAPHRSNPNALVGYKNPPLHTRFKPGQSGNKNGRPKGRRNLKHDLQSEFSERISVREGDRTVRMTKQRAMVKSVVARAIKGDVRAQAKAFELLRTGVPPNVGAVAAFASEFDVVNVRTVSTLGI